MQQQTKNHKKLKKTKKTMYNLMMTTMAETCSC